MRGQSFRRQRAIAASSRSRARASGFCTLKPIACRMRPTWLKSYQTSKVLPIRSRTRRQVHRSLSYPAARAPFLSMARSRRLCAGLSRACRPGCGLALRPLRPRRRRAFFHLLTHEGVTPTRRATSLVPLPRPNRTAARSRRASRSAGVPLLRIPLYRHNRSNVFQCADVNR